MFLKQHDLGKQQQMQAMASGYIGKCRKSVEREYGRVGEQTVSCQQVQPKDRPGVLITTLPMKTPLLRAGWRSIIILKSKHSPASDLYTNTLFAPLPSSLSFHGNSHQMEWVGKGRVEGCCAGCDGFQACNNNTESWQTMCINFPQEREITVLPFQFFYLKNIS